MTGALLAAGGIVAAVLATRLICGWIEWQDRRHCAFANDTHQPTDQEQP